MAAKPEPAADPDPRVDRPTRDLAEALDQQLATNEVLEVIGRSAFELQPVFETVARHAARLCRADAALIHQRDGDRYRLTFIVGGAPEYREELERNPVGEGRGTLIGRVGLERRTVQIEDVLADSDYQWHRARELGGFRTLLGVPMLVDQEVVGVITIWRQRVDPFDERTIRLATTFAAQAGVAIQNVQLFQDLQQREHELATAVEELHVLGEVSQAVSSSLDLHQVLTTIVTRATQLSRTDGGSIFEFDPTNRRFHLSACHGTTQELSDRLWQTRIHLEETFLGRAVACGEARQAPDLEQEAADPHIDVLLKAGWRSMLVVPLLREQEIMGALVVRRKGSGAFDTRTVDLLETLAGQSTMAIHNAGVFRELEEKSRQLEVASQHKSEFLASMSHELRTPLNAVIGFSDVLLERLAGDINEKQEEYLLDIRDSGRHLLQLINEILDLSKVEAGRMELELASVSLAELMAHGLAMVRERAERHDITLELDVDPGIGFVRADGLKLRQVVVNLLSNAVKFTGDGGSVLATARIAGDEAHVSVTDTGIGIAEIEQERIFEAFQSGSRGARASMEGTGLGLTLSKRIVELHGGRIWMRSRLGEGSTFSFAIPTRMPSEAEASRDGADAAAAAPERTVLIVEDDRHSIDLLTLYLESEGFGVVVARDGVEGLELARKLRPRAVILDILLPRLDGWELLGRLKSEPSTAAIPVVVVSMLDERGKGFALGAAEYLVKPVAREDVLDALARCARAKPDRHTVVVIDDDPVELNLVEAALAPAGYVVLRAGGGEEGVNLVQRELPGLVLLDLLMPEVDGFAVIERLRADPATADIPIVVLTAKDMTAADRARLAGQISHLAQKGACGRAELVELVRNVGERAPLAPEGLS